MPGADLIQAKGADVGEGVLAKAGLVVLQAR
jgi:hypothetical protein